MDNITDFLYNFDQSLQKILQNELAKKQQVKKTANTPPPTLDALLAAIATECCAENKPQSAKETKDKKREDVKTKDKKEDIEFSRTMLVTTLLLYFNDLGILADCDLYNDAYILAAIDTFNDFEKQVKFLQNLSEISGGILKIAGPDGAKSILKALLE